MLETEHITWFLSKNYDHRNKWVMIKMYFLFYVKKKKFVNYSSRICPNKIWYIFLLSNKSNFCYITSLTIMKYKMFQPSFSLVAFISLYSL